MRHSRPDYNRIQDPTGRIPMDEPVFLLRAQDPSAAAAVRLWAAENIKNGGDPEASQLALKQAKQMESWEHKPVDLHPDRDEEVRSAVESDTLVGVQSRGFDNDGDLD